MKHKKTFLWFGLGLGSELQLVYSLGVSELAILCAAIVMLPSEYKHMRRTGVAKLFLLSLLTIFGCAVASVVNHTAPAFVLRGMAVLCILSSAIVVTHYLLRKDPGGVKWYFLGNAISLIVCTFIFKKSVEVSMSGGIGDIESIMSGQLYWTQRLSPWILLLTRGWYIHMPRILNVAAPLCCVAVTVLMSGGGSGRSAALTMLAFAAIALIGGTRQNTMIRLKKYFWLLITVAVMGLGIISGVYRIMAVSGALGEKARDKYEMQTQGEGGIVRLIIGGRGDSFVGLLACRDKPLVGWGPWPKDPGWRYRIEFVRRFGTGKDYDDMEKLFLAYGGESIGLASHSHITEFWVCFGILGLVFILYVLFVIIRFIRQDAHVVPQWFGWLACGIPGWVWHIFFSPFAARIALPMFVVACLLARAVRRRQLQLPLEMIEEMNMKGGRIVI